MQAAKPLTKPTKQRRMIFQAPAHMRHRLLAAHLAPELRTSQGVKSFPVRTGDTVRVMRGDHKGVEGKITRVDLEKYRIYVEGLTREKVDGTTVFVPVHPSKVIVTRLDLDDKWRKEIFEIKKKQLEKAGRLGKPEEKPKLKPVKKPEKAEEVKEAAEKKPAIKEKVVKKKVAKARKMPARKKVEEKRKSEPEEAVKEKEKPKTRPKKPARPTARKTAKKTEEGEE